MSEKKFLTPVELSERYGGRITVRTLANWRTQGAGPPFSKIGGAILYPADKLADWENRNTVTSTSQYGSQTA
ncbi:HTH binding protein [Pseudomonas phage Dolphis]|nr:HTH binding protein [Pseudomonas phage Dolphis]